MHVKPRNVSLRKWDLNVLPKKHQNVLISYCGSSSPCEIFKITFSIYVSIINKNGYMPMLHQLATNTNYVIIIIFNVKVGQKGPP